MPQNLDATYGRINIKVSKDTKEKLIKYAEQWDMNLTQFMKRRVLKGYEDLLFLKLLFEEGKVKVYGNKLSTYERARLDEI